MPEPAKTPIASDWGSRRQVHGLVLLAATAGGIWLCWLLAAPFLPALVWALALAVLFAPLHAWLETRITRPNLAATAALLVVIVIVIVPASFVMERLAGEVAKGAGVIGLKVESGAWRQAVDVHPRIAPVTEWIEQHIDLPGTLRAAAAWLTNTATSLVRGSLVQLVGLLLTFYLLFYFLRDRRAALAAIRELSPLAEAEMSRLFARVSDTIYATIYGTVAVAAVQGTLAGLMFWWLGLPAPLLWGIVMGLLAVVPVLGAFVVWVPAAIFLALAGDWGKAVLLTVWGGVVVAGIDNLLYPMLVGNRLKMHTVLAFISVVGGLIVFGASGLILGPVAVTVTLLLLEFWHRRNAASVQLPDSE